MPAAPKRASAKPAGKPAAPVKTGESAPSETLTDEETAAVEDRKSGSAKVLHEVVRLQGDEELDRPAVSLVLSGLAGGVGITASGFAGASLASRLGPAPRPSSSRRSAIRSASSSSSWAVCSCSPRRR